MFEMFALSSPPAPLQINPWWFSNFSIQVIQKHTDAVEVRRIDLERVCVESISSLHNGAFGTAEIWPEA